MLKKGYKADQSAFGNVYYPSDGIVVHDEISVNYVEHPWITCFEVEGISFLEKAPATW